MEVEVLNTTTNYDDLDFLSAESSVDADDFCEIIDGDDDDDGELAAAGLYFSLPDISLADFGYQLTEPLWSSSMSDHDSSGDWYPFDPSSVSSLLLIPKNTTKKPKIEYVSLSQTQSNNLPFLTFLDSPNIQILQSCNGLFLCCSLSSKLYYIFDPITQQPEEPLPSSPNMTGQFSLNLAFDPHTLAHYKVICVQKLDRQKPAHQIATYSSETRIWTVTSEPFDALDDIDFNDGVFCNGSVHWMRRTSNGLYFNINTGLLSIMPKAPLKEGYSFVSCEYFGESQGCLYCVVACPELPYLELFEMKKDYSGWVMKTQIDLKALAVEFPIMARRSRDPHPLFPRYESDVLFVGQGRDNEDVEVVLSIPGAVIAYNEEKKCARKLCDLRLGPNDRVVWYRVYSCFNNFEV